MAQYRAQKFAAMIEPEFDESHKNFWEWGVGRRNFLSPLPTPHSPLPTPYSLLPPLPTRGKASRKIFTSGILDRVISAGVAQAASLPPASTPTFVPSEKA